MINRICISINNRCNIACRYCHFREKGVEQVASMDVFAILDNVRSYASGPFKIGFVGNGEPFLDYPILKSCIEHISDCEFVRMYTITNGTISLPKSEYLFLERHGVNVGFSIDGHKEIHDRNRCNTFDLAMANVEAYRKATGHYPTFNATIGKESLAERDALVSFFAPFETKVTFSRMIGENGITLDEYREFLDWAGRQIPVRIGGLDCTMYGGICAAGANNYYFANGFVYYCGNCVDMPPVAASDIDLHALEDILPSFDRSRCYKESCL